MTIEGQRVAGEFAWFESTGDGSLPHVRVVFWALSGDRYYLVDVNATDGRDYCGLATAVIEPSSPIFSAPFGKACAVSS